MPLTGWQGCLINRGRWRCWGKVCGGSCITGCCRVVHGPAIRALGAVDSHSARIRRAVAMLRRDFMQPVSVDALADAAGMSVSVFHRHFRAMTTLSPLQFQKQLRLIHARRLMLAEGMSIAQAAGEVGYISVSQFTREYARLYGAPPGRDRRREKMSA
ncbi:hypothetical protein AE72_01989 [Klebsiella pneumoniae CHS 16]|nr:hypothetical protein AE72_01989 [Klebsiella pneumoniae CHS 16]VTM26124.1 AraC family transcriptional regulator [Klebsiella pneumoniae]